MTIRGQLASDVGWCWWTQPRATRIGSRLYLGGISSDGSVVAVTHDLVTGTSDRFVLATLEPDDHNNPAVVATPDRPLLAFYSRHDADNVVRWRRSSAPLDISEWTSERTLDFGDITTYAQVHAHGDELHLFTRVGDTSWGYTMSPDWGATWTAPVSFISLDTDQETYMPTALLDDGRTLRVAIAGHPKSYERKPVRRISAAAVDLATGAVTLPSSGREVGNLRTGAGMPLSGEQLERVCDAEVGRTVNLFDVGSGDIFEVGFASKLERDDRTVDARYHVAALRGATWTVDDVVGAGDIFGYIDAGFYVGGISFPLGRSEAAYISREHDGDWHLELWERTAAGAWRAQPLVEPTSVRVVRPWPVRNPADGLEVVALRLERYDDDYMQTVSHLVGAGLGT